MAESDLIRGNVDTIILKILYEGDRYGYDLIRQINARSDGQWEIKQPTVYACLKRLEKQGFISSYWDAAESDGGRRKYYSLTDSGKEVFLKYKNEFERTTALFGELITGAEPTVFIQPEHDFSDIEEDGYALPKRKAKPRAKKPKEEKAEPAPPPQDEAENEPVIDNSEPIEPAIAYTPEPEKFVQPDIFSLAQADEPAPVEPDEQAVEENTEMIEQATEQEAQEPIIEEEIPAAVTALDPRAIIERCYNNENGRSYADEYRRYVEPTKPTPVPAPPPPPEPKAEPAPPPPPPPPAPVASTVPAPQQSTAPAPAASKQVYAPPREEFGFEMPEEESPARREYRTVLSDLVDRSQFARPAVRERPIQAEEQAAIAPEQVQPSDERFARVRQAALDMGSSVQIREHNNSAKEYTQRYRYYSNRLLMTHYTIMCSCMFLVGLILFLTFYIGMGMRMKYDYILYIAAGLFPIVLFITAVIRFAGDPDKTNRINVNFKFSIIIRCVIMVQVAVVIYCLNLIWGMPIGFSAHYVPSLVIPLAYALFIPISEVIFMTLLRSGNYADGTIEYVADDVQ